MNAAMNETLIRDVVAEVLDRLGGAATAVTPRSDGQPAAKEKCNCRGRNGHSGGRLGVFEDAAEACSAAADAFVQLQQKGVEARRKVVDIIKKMCEANATEWGRIELEETKIGRLDHKIEKLQII